MKITKISYEEAKRPIATHVMEIKPTDWEGADNSWRGKLRGQLHLLKWKLLRLLGNGGKKP